MRHLSEVTLPKFLMNSTAVYLILPASVQQRFRLWESRINGWEMSRGKSADASCHKNQTLHLQPRSRSTIDFPSMGREATGQVPRTFMIKFFIVEILPRFDLSLFTFFLPMADVQMSFPLSLAVAGSRRLLNNLVS